MESAAAALLADRGLGKRIVVAHCKLVCTYSVE